MTKLRHVKKGSIFAQRDSLHLHVVPVGAEEDAGEGEQQRERPTVAAGTSHAARMKMTRLYHN